MPIGCCVGFAYVLRHTGCDQHLVHLLVRPLRRVRCLLIPGVVLVGFAGQRADHQPGRHRGRRVGSVLVPLLRAARLSPITVGAALLLGCSHRRRPAQPRRAGTAAPSREALRHRQPTECVARVWPLLLVQLGVATPLFWLLSLPRRTRPRTTADDRRAGRPETAFRVNHVKALVPLVPLVLLFLTGSAAAPVRRAARLADRRRRRRATRLTSTAG